MSDNKIETRKRAEKSAARAKLAALNGWFDDATIAELNRLLERVESPPVLGALS